MEDAWFGHVSVVQETFGIDLGRQQPKHVDAEQFDIANGSVLQKYSNALGE